jgi:hypothetical protein
MDETTRTRVTRRIAADPTSTALLLAGPLALELWPGVRSRATAGGRVLAEVDLAGGPATAASVRARPPLRTPTSFVTRFEWAGPGLPSTTGVLTLAYDSARRDDGAPTTSAALVLDSTGLPSRRLDAAGLRELAEGFLDNLAAAAEERSEAA